MIQLEVDVQKLANNNAIVVSSFSHHQKCQVHIGEFLVPQYSAKSILFIISDIGHIVSLNEEKSKKYDSIFI